MWKVSLFILQVIILDPSQENAAELLSVAEMFYSNNIPLRLVFVPGRKLWTVNLFNWIHLRLPLNMASSFTRLRQVKLFLGMLLSSEGWGFMWVKKAGLALKFSPLWCRIGLVFVVSDEDDIDGMQDAGVALVRAFNYITDEVDSHSAFEAVISVSTWLKIGKPLLPYYPSAVSYSYFLLLIPFPPPVFRCSTACRSVGS